MHTFPFPGHSLVLKNITHADNCHLYDSEGNRYVDLESGIWCTSIGHGNEAVRATLSRQATAISHIGFSYTTSSVERAAGRVLGLTNCENGRCTFLCSGSEAVEYGIRTIRAVMRRPRIFTMEDSYFGAYGDAAIRGDECWSTFNWFDCDTCSEERCSMECPRLAAVPFDEIGAFIFEPGSSSGLVRFPPEKLINALAQWFRENDGLVMVNEVTTGIGRTGKWFGFQYFDIKPDIVAMGKGIGNGYPVSATTVNKRVVDMLDGVPPSYGQSHFNDPLGAAVAESVINEIQDKKLIERCERISSLLLSGLHDIAHENPSMTVRGRGLMAVIEFETDAVDVDKLHRDLIDTGFILAHRKGSAFMRLDPALTVEQDDIRQFLQTLENLLPEATASEFAG